MKKTISLILILCLLALSLSACGEKDEDPEKITSAYSQGLAFEVSAENPAECIITGIGSCTDKNIVIPSYINGMRVVGIKDGAFSPKAGDAVASTAAPRGFAEVAMALLRSRVSMNGLLMGGTVYEAYVTGGSSSGVQFGIMDGSAEPYETGSGEPIDLEQIESVQIPVTVRVIGEEAFYGCEELETISAHGALSTIGKDAFKETAYYNDPENWDGQALYLSTYLLNVSANVSGEFTVREGTTMIADSAFYQCYSVTAVNLASTVTAVGSYAFYGCVALTYVNTAGTLNYTLGENAFEGCFSYVTTLPGGVTVTPGVGSITPLYDEIDEAAFERAKKNPPVNYTYTELIVEAGSKTCITIKADGVDSYYMYSADGDTPKELFVHTEEGGTTAYGWFGDGLYRTTATMPEPTGIPEDLHFADLKCKSDSLGSYYTYVIDEEKSIELRFKDGALVFMMAVSGEYSIEIRYSDFGKTEVPEPSLELLIPGVIVDANGDPIVGANGDLQ